MMTKNKEINYQIISLGSACMTRAFLAQANLISTKKTGRKSMIFDLMPNPTSAIIKCLRDNFDSYFDDFAFEYLASHHQSYWHNKKYDVYYVHDRDCKNNFNKFKKRYQARINNFTEALYSSQFTYFIHYPFGLEDATEDINNLYKIIKDKREKKPFKLIIWDVLDNIKQELNPEISIIREFHPRKIAEDWWNPEFWNDDAIKWKENLIKKTKQEIEKNGHDIEYFYNTESVQTGIFFNEKILKIAKNIFKIINDHDNNRKIMKFLGLTIPLRKLHPFEYSDVIVKLDGRMGNQMFQWAFIRAFEQKRDILPLIDDSKETIKLTPFKMMKDIKIKKKPLWNIILRKIIIFRNLRNKITELKYTLPLIKEENNNYTPKLFTVETPAYIFGYFQCEKYFENVREQLLKDFELTKPLNNKNKKMLNKIKNTESVSIHFRRGDYTKTRVAQYLGMCSTEYYKNAVKVIADKLDKKTTLFVFSDDMKWVKENVEFDFDTVYVDINSGKQGYFDLELMKNCKHNIISNSSFSWMGAWLNDNPNKIVVAPTPWHNSDTINSDDIVPDSWIKLKK